MLELIKIFLPFLVISILLMFRIYLMWTRKSCKCKTKMNGKTILITGANSGIGKETARDLAKRGARIIMASRNIQLTKEVKEEIIKETGNYNIIVEKLDLGDFNSIRNFAERINCSEDKLDVLIHNAGTYLAGNYGKTIDGIELTFATNHLGSFLLTHLLINLLKKSKQARILIVASAFHVFSYVNFKNFNHEILNKQNTLINYCFSKRCNILFTKELAQRLKKFNITVNAINPGAVDTNIIHSSSKITKILVDIIRVYLRTPVEGAQTNIHLAVSENLTNITGKYFKNCKQRKSACESESEIENSKYLWKLSEKLVKLNEKEKI